MPNKRLTPRFVENSTVLPGQKRTEYWDDKAPGLMLRVTDKGARSWVYAYRDPINKRYRKHTFGSPASHSLAEARDYARECLTDVRNGIDPVTKRETAIEEQRQAQLEAQQKLYTFDNLADDWTRRHVDVKLKPSTAAEYKRHLDTYLRPELGPVPIRDITKAEVLRVINLTADKGNGGSGAPVTADRLKATLSSMFNWAIDEGMLEQNPAYRIRRRAPSKPRERILKDEQFPVFWKALDKTDLSDQLRVIFKLLLYTGVRRSQVAGARLEELSLDGDKPYWEVGRDRAKNSRGHVLPLSEPAVALFKDAIEDFSDDTYVFPAFRSISRTPHINGESVSHAMRDVREVAKLPELTTHDLRRTVGTGMARLGVPKEIRAHVLNHKTVAASSVTTAVYDQYDYFDEKKDALDLWANEVQNMISSSPQ